MSFAEDRYMAEKTFKRIERPATAEEIAFMKFKPNHSALGP